MSCRSRCALLTACVHAYLVPARRSSGWLVSRIANGEVRRMADANDRDGRDERDGREREEPTREVGDEGGSPGDLELERTTVVTGSEATSTVVSRPSVKEVRRDETGEGRRTP